MNGFLSLSLLTIPCILWQDSDPIHTYIWIFFSFCILACCTCFWSLKTKLQDGEILKLHFPGLILKLHINTGIIVPTSAYHLRSCECYECGRSWQMIGLLLCGLVVQTTLQTEIFGLDPSVTLAVAPSRRQATHMNLCVYYNTWF